MHELFLKDSLMICFSWKCHTLLSWSMVVNKFETFDLCVHFQGSCRNWKLILKTDCSNILRGTFFFSWQLNVRQALNNIAICVHYSSRQLGACGCWWIFDERIDPLPGQVEYSVHTQSHRRALTDTHMQIYPGAHAYTRWYSFSAVQQLSERQWRWYKSILQNSLMKKYTRKWCLSLFMVSILEIMRTHTTHTCKVIVSFSLEAFKPQELNTKRATQIENKQLMQEVHISIGSY